jgi:outer membrane protein OmpA-like peptidoglycan-associated protein
MNRRISRMVVTSTLAGCLVMTCSSCAGLRGQTPSDAPRDGATHAAHVPLRQRLAQFSFGRDAAFGVCAEPACPQVTPKTLATALPTAQPVALREPIALPTSTIALPVEATRTAAAAPQPTEAEKPVPADARRHLVLTFAFASAELSPSARAALDASMGDAKKADRIVISGRTDAIGDLEVNQALAMARALAVRDRIRTVAPDARATISIDAKGRCCFVASNSDEDGRARTRRVEIVFMAAGGA